MRTYCDLKHIYECFRNVNQQISSDTRKELSDTLFFCLSGEKFDGNLYASEALKSGARYVVTNNTEVIDDRVLLVENPNNTLAELAKYHVKQLKCKLIGIGGSNGKTTTKELMHSVLSLQYKVVATKGNFNNHIGVPLTLLSLEDTTEIGIIEMGTNHPGEMAFLCNLFNIDSAVVTNIGKEHLEGFKDIEAVAKEESELFLMAIRDSATVFLNNDDIWLKSMSKRLTQKITYSINDNSAELFVNVIEEMPFLKLSVYHRSQKLGDINMNIGGDFNAYNAASAISAGLYYNVSFEHISKALSEYTSRINRSQWLNTSDGKQILLDAYNANPSSMSAGIKSFAKIKDAKKALLLGDMLELGDHSINEHREMFQLAVSLGFDEIYFVGAHFKAALTEYPFVFENANSLMAWLDTHPIQAQYIYIKGSRGIAMEQCLDYFNVSIK